ncbi:MAG TPA: phospholipase D-like domain-containing protein [Myxococcaceae bacterium]|nr:phospholipase D-like domain-containing protein [Myxococcaceae bacterium]
MAQAKWMEERQVLARALSDLKPVRTLADRAFSRAAGAPLIPGNRVELLRDAAENYPAWLEAIARARRYIHFESYIIAEDAEGRRFADALIERAQAGVQVRLIYDWVGGFGQASENYWERLRRGGVEVRCYNPFNLLAPFDLVSRDHRKMVSVDGEVSFVSGLCVGRAWSGIPEKGLGPWRDTGIRIRGPAVADIDRAFAEMWATLGDPLPPDLEPVASSPAGDMNVRVVATTPATAGVLRLDQLVTALARQRIWLTDAYYAGTTAYAQSLRSAAREGVDVRLLLPGATDIPLLRPLSRSGYRTLLEAGVRIFEWNGTMLHAKSSVVDGRWARVGSTNLNIASWFGNCELDVVIEDPGFAAQMEAQYLEDLSNATEVVLNARNRVFAPRPVDAPPTTRMLSGGGGASTVAAGAARLGHALGAAFIHRRELEPVEAYLTLGIAAVLLAVVALLIFFPMVLAWPTAVVLTWVALTQVVRSVQLWKQLQRSREAALKPGPDDQG